jgi:hypothetical protein
MNQFRDLVDKAFNWSGGAYVGLSTFTVLGLAIAEYLSGSPTYITGPDGRNIIYIVHRAPEWFVNSIGVYTIILTVFAMSKPINTLIAQKGNPPPEPAPAPAERPLEK